MGSLAVDEAGWDPNAWARRQSARAPLAVPFGMV